jgi:colanic acid/amylovoran biosynthesis glycosyltransferase
MGVSDEPLRIAFFIDVFPRISNTFVLNQITGLIDRGHEVEIFARSVRPFDDAHEQVRRYELDRKLRHLPIPGNIAGRLLTAARHLAEPYAWHCATLDAFDVRRHGRKALNLAQLYTTLSFLRNCDYDIIHAQFGHLGPSLLPLRRTGAIEAPLVVSFRGADLSSVVERAPRAYDELLRAGDLFLPVSDYFRRRLEGLGAPAERTHVLRSGIDLGRFPFRERSRGPGEPTRALFVGRLTEKKGISLAIEAIARAAAAGHEVELTVVGEGELESAARCQAAEWGVAARVRWEGPQPAERVAAHMARAHLLIAPFYTAANGDQEGVPNVLKEAMASGLPVLSTTHSGVPELVDDGVSGYLVPERDPDALYRRLLDLLDHPERWASMGRCGRAKVEKEYDGEVLNDRLLSLYRRLLSTPGEGVTARQRMSCLS